MTDTPKHIQELQLSLWLQKTPGDRLLQSLKNNELVFLLFKEARKAALSEQGTNHPAPETGLSLPPSKTFR